MWKRRKSGGGAARGSQTHQDGAEPLTFVADAHILALAILLARLSLSWDVSTLGSDSLFA